MCVKQIIFSVFFSGKTAVFLVIFCCFTAEQNGQVLSYDIKKDTSLLKCPVSIFQIDICLSHKALSTIVLSLHYALHYALHFSDKISSNAVPLLV